MPTEEGTPVVNTEAETQVTAPTESTTVDNKAPVLDEDGIDISFAQDDGQERAEETPEAPKPESDDQDAEEKQDADAETEEPAEDQEKTSRADARKEQLQTEIRDLVALRNSLLTEVEARNAEVYKPASPDELTEQVNPETGEYYSRLEAQVEAMRQENEVSKYNREVAETQLTLTSEAQRALQEFPIFDETSPEYQPAIAAQVDQVLGQSLVFDPNTKQIIGSKVSPYALYKAVADAAKVSAAKSAADGQKAVEKMMANADIPSRAPSPKATKDDSELSAEEYAAKHKLKMVEY